MMPSIDRTDRTNRNIAILINASASDVGACLFLEEFLVRILNPAYPNAMLPIIKTAEKSHLSHPRTARAINRSVDIALKNQFTTRFIGCLIHIVL